MKKCKCYSAIKVDELRSIWGDRREDCTDVPDINKPIKRKQAQRKQAERNQE